MTDKDTTRQLYDALRVLAEGTYKEVLFDLDTDKLPEPISEEGAHGAVRSVETGLGKLGYGTFQYSGCASRGPKSTVEVFLDMEELGRKLPWFYPACHKCHASTLLGPMFDLKELHDLRAKRRVEGKADGHGPDIADLHEADEPSPESPSEIDRPAQQ